MGGSGFWLHQQNKTKHSNTWWHDHDHDNNNNNITMCDERLKELLKLQRQQFVG
jgi:hypothetical protein